MGVRDAYDLWAPTYDADRNLTRDLDAQVTRAALAGASCTRILELGCGTGQNTAFLAQFGAPVLALDFSAAMLRQAQAKLPLAHVALLVADLTAPWPCAERSVDLIVGNAAGDRLWVGGLHPLGLSAQRRADRPRRRAPGSCGGVGRREHRAVGPG